MRNITIAVVLSLVIIGGALAVIVFIQGGENGAPGPDRGLSNLPADTSDSEPAKAPSEPEKPPKKPKAKVAVEVKVVDGENQPVPNAQIRIHHLNVSKGIYGLGKPVATFFTNQAGLGKPREKLETGKYRFWARAPRYAPHSKSVELTRDQDPRRVTIGLYSGVTITGTVYTKEKEPIANARVVGFEALVRKGGGEYDWLMLLAEKHKQQKLEKPISETTTDAKGRYTLAGLTSDAVCTIRVLADGREPGKKEPVKAGARNVDFYLESGATLTGEVLGMGGRPVAEATIDAYQKSQPGDLRSAVANAMRGAVDTVSTDGQGQFTFGTLGKGQYLLVASGPAHKSQSKEVTITPGGNNTVTFNLEKGLLLSGVVQDANGVPVEGARVTVQPQSSISGGAARKFAMKRSREIDTVTDKQGRFRFDSLSGECTLVVSHQELASSRQREVQVPRENIVVVLGEGGSIGGYVKDSSGDPVVGACVSLQDVPGVPKEAHTDGEGWYRIDGLSVKPSAKKFVRLEAAGYARPDSQSVQVEEGRLVEVNWELVQSSRIAGKVTDTSGSPVENATVLVQRPATEENPVTRYMGFSHSASDGSFEILDVAPKRNVRLIVKHPLYLTWNSAPFEVRPGESLEAPIELKVGNSVSGQVVNESGEPLEGVRVKAVIPGESAVGSLLGMASKRTGERGRFKLPGLEAGVYELVAQKRGFLEGRSEQIDLGEGASISGVEIRLVKGRSVAGVVIEEGGAPVAGAEITVIDTSYSTRELSAVSDREGRWEVGELGEAPVEVQAEAEGFAKASLRNVSPGSTEVELVLAPLGAIEGRVEKADGSPLNAFSAKAEPAQVDPGYDTPRTRFHTFSQDDGGFHLKNLPPGLYTVNVQAPGYTGTKIDKIHVMADNVSDVGTVTLRVGGHLSGKVVSPDGNPVNEAKVSVIGGTARFVRSKRDSGNSPVYTGPDGAFSFEGLKGGNTRIRASKPGFLDATKSVDPNSFKGSLTLTLGVSASIVGTVVDEQARPCARVDVYLTGETSRKDKSDSNGRFEFNGLPAGDYTVRTFSFKNRGGDPLSVQLRQGEVVEVELAKP